MHPLVHITFLISHQIVLTSFICASISSHACIHRLRLDEVHTTFSDQRLVSISKPQEGLLCQVCFNSLFTQATYTQDRLRHVHQMKIISFRQTAHFQPDLSLSVFLERFSVCTSETSCTIQTVPVWRSQTTWDTR